MSNNGPRKSGWAGWLVGIGLACCSLPLLLSVGVLTAVSGVWLGGLAVAVICVAVITALALRRRIRAGADLGKRGVDDERSRDRVLR